MTVFQFDWRVVAFVSVSFAAAETANGDWLCPCGSVGPRPEAWNKAATARWMVHHIDWGVVTTISSRSTDISNGGPVPFGNVYSFVDGPCNNATGIPFFYGTYMDQSLKDMKVNPVASLTLSEASIVTSCIGQTNAEKDDDTGAIVKACRVVSGESISPHRLHSNSVLSESGDPESPLCARLTLTGVLEPIASSNDAFNDIQDAIFQRHPQMSNWPIDHHWVIFQLRIQDIWLIDYFGGASIISPRDYFAVPQSILYSATETEKVLNDPV
jgi:Pyridoxamine 5'-phosphate oxidase